MKFLHLSTVAALTVMASPAFAQYLAQPDQVPNRYIPSVNAPAGSPQPAMTEYQATPAAPSTTTYSTDPNTTTSQYPTPVPVQGYTPPVPYTPPAGTITYSGTGIATQPYPTPPAPPEPAYAPAAAPAPTPVAVPTPLNPNATVYSEPMGADNQAQPSGDFVSGGVGGSDQDYMRSIEKNYNLKVLYAGTGGEYLAIVNAKITDKQGNVLYQSATDGPILLAKLKPGTYTVESELNGVTKTNKVTTGNGLRSITVRF